MHTTVYIATVLCRLTALENYIMISLRFSRWRLPMSLKYSFTHCFDDTLSQKENMELKLLEIDLTLKRHRIQIKHKGERARVNIFFFSVISVVAISRGHIVGDVIS